MKLDAVQKNRDVQSSSDDQLDYGIDTSQMWLLYEILSQYSNPIGSIVRELTTNAFDSHLESNVSERVTVRVIEGNSLTNTQTAFEVEDYGMGFSPERIKNTYSKFLGSTKREDNVQHGAFGLGSKSPFSYTDMFYMTTRYEGTEYFYAMHKGSNVPRIDLLSKEPTDKTNGTLVSINIKDNDKYKFLKEIKRQLAYFDNIDHVNTGVDNDYRIIEGDHFIFREHAQDLNLNRLHICLGKVYYPIDFNSVNIERLQNVNRYYGSKEVQTPIALKFEIGELPIIWSRENIEYTNEAIQTIEEKYEKAQKELQKLFQQKSEKVHTVRDYFEMKQQTKSNELELLDGVVIPNINHMIETDLELDVYSELNSLPAPENVASLLYKMHKKVSSGIAHSLTSTYDKTLHNRVWSSGSYVNGMPFSSSAYLLEEAYETKKNKYLYEEIGVSVFYLVSKKPDSEKPLESEILSLFGYEEKSFDKVDESIITLIKNYTKECIKLMKEGLQSYKDVDVPDDYDPTPTTSTRTDIYNPKSDEYQPNKKIHFKSVKVDDSYYRTKIKGFTVYEPTIKFLQNHENQLRVYGFQEDSDLLEEISSFIYYCYNSDFFDVYRYRDMPNPKRFMFLKIAKGKEDVLMDLSNNAIHINDFVNKRHKILVRELTYYYILNKLDNESEFPIGSIDFSSLLLTRSMGMHDFYNQVRDGYNIISTCRSRDFGDPEMYSSRSKVPKSLRYMLESPAFLNQDILESYHKAVCYIKKYPLIYSLITTPLDDEMKDLLKEELKFYLKGKDSINPLLRNRLKESKRTENLTELERILETLNLNLSN